MSPAGSNNTATGRPPLWTNSSQRKVSRLYLYTTLPIKKIIEVVHARSPDTAPGKESAHKKLNALLDKEPRWLHPRTESDMTRRLNELSLSPTRSSSRSSSPQPHAASVSPGHLNPDPNSWTKREAGTSPTCLEVPAFHQFPSPQYAPAPAPAFDPSPVNEPARPERQLSNDHHHEPFAEFLRRTTCMSNSTQGTQRTTGSLHRILSDYPIPYIHTVKRLVKRYTAPLNNQAECLSPASGMNINQVWLNNGHASLEFPGMPYFLPGDALDLERLRVRIQQCPSDRHTSILHAKEVCLCLSHQHIVNSSILGSVLARYSNGFWQSRFRPSDLELRDDFGNNLLHQIAKCHGFDITQRLVVSGQFNDMLNARNTAGQTYLHVLSPAGAESRDEQKVLLEASAAWGCDIFARDFYGRTIFHLFPSLLDHPYDLDRDFPGWRDRLTRDAFNTLPVFQPHTGMYHVPVDEMDVDPLPIPAPDPRDPVLNGDQSAYAAEQATLLAIVRNAQENPKLQHTDGGNGLHCLAAVTLSKSSLFKMLGLNQPSSAGPQSSKDKEPKNLDSSSERMAFRLHEMKALLEAGVDPNHYDSNGYTPLMMFAAKLPEEGDYKTGPDILRALIHKGANVHARNRRGETALHIAVRCGRKLAMRTLVEEGANVHVRDSEGRSLLDVTDVEMKCSPLSPAQYAHLEACRAWLSGKGMAVQSPTILQEWRVPPRRFG